MIEEKISLSTFADSTECYRVVIMRKRDLAICILGHTNMYTHIDTLIYVLITNNRLNYIPGAQTSNQQTSGLYVVGGGGGG